MIYKFIDGKLLLALAVLCGCLGAAYGSYEGIYKTTPDYSLHCLKQAAKQHHDDVWTRWIDKDAVIHDAYNGFIQFHHQQLATPLQKLTWLPIQNDLESALTTWIEHEITQSDTTNIEQTQAILSNHLKNMGISLPLTGWSLSSSSWSRRIDDSHAEITLYFYHPSLQQTIPCTVSMERTGPKEWHITGITHIQDSIQQLQQAYLEALDKENGPMRHQIASMLEVKHVRSRLVRSDDYTQVFLRMEYTPVFHIPRQQILDVQGIYELRRKTDHELFFTAPVHLSLTSDKTTRMAQFPLRSSIPAQEEIMKSPSLTNTESFLYIHAVTLRDGTSYALETTLSF